MSRLISHLSPRCQSLYLAFQDECDNQGLDYILTCTWRSHDEQEALYAKGRTVTGKVVTWAKPGQSKHNTVTPDGKPASEAFDIVPLRFGKVLVWGTAGDGIDDNPADDHTDDLELWQRFGMVGKSVGLKWAGDWPKGKREFPHFEVP